MTLTPPLSPPGHHQPDLHPVGRVGRVSSRGLCGLRASRVGSGVAGPRGGVGFQVRGRVSRDPSLPTSGSGAAWSPPSPPLAPPRKELGQGPKVGSSLRRRRVRILEPGGGGLSPGAGGEAFPGVVRGWASLSLPVPLSAGVGIPEASLHPFPRPPGSVRCAARPSEPGGHAANPLCSGWGSDGHVSWEGRKAPVAADSRDKLAWQRRAWRQKHSLSTNMGFGWHMWHVR